MPICCYDAGEGAAQSAGASHQANGTADAAPSGSHSIEAAVENGGPESSAAAAHKEANGHPEQSTEAASPADEILLVPADAGAIQSSSFYTCSA